MELLYKNQIYGMRTFGIFYFIYKNKRLQKIYLGLLQKLQKSWFRHTFANALMHLALEA